MARTSPHSSDHPAGLDRDDLVRALQARERFLDAILGSLEAFVAVDAEWRITYANAAAARLARSSVDELVGRDVREVMPTASHETPAGALRRAMDERVAVEYEVAAPDGREFAGAAHPTEDGGLALYVRDITATKQREDEREALLAALQRSEQSFAAIFEASPFAMSLTEMPSGRLLRVNTAFEECFGYTRDELVGRTSVELGISDAESQDEVSRRFAEEGVVREVEVRRNIRGGEPRTMSISLDWVTLGQQKAVLTSVRDVTRRRRDEEALRAGREALVESEARYRSIVETTGDGIMIAGPDGAISFVNQRMADMLGYERDELTGMQGLDLVSPGWQARVRDYRVALDTGEIVRGEFKLRRKDGSTIWTVFSATPMFDAAGTHVGNLTLHSDITELKTAQQALHESELAAAAQEERSRLARDLHDSVTQALFAASLKAEALTTAGDVSPEMARVVEDVRRLTGGALAQMRTMLLELRGEPLDTIPLRQLLRNVVEATESRTQTRLDLRVDGDGDLPPEVHVALYRIAQEALNNVVRHARAQRAWVHLSVAPDCVRLAVADDGIGFEMRPLEASHLGLRSMRERAAEAGAELRLESSAGRGTSLVVEWRPPAS